MFTGSTYISLVHSVQWLKPVYDVHTKIQGKGLVKLLVSPCSSAGEGCSYISSNQKIGLNEPVQHQINLIQHKWLVIQLQWLEPT